MKRDKSGRFVKSKSKRGGKSATKSNVAEKRKKIVNTQLYELSQFFLNFLIF